MKVAVGALLRVPWAQDLNEAVPKMF
jgi:hypothetical protein